MDTNVYIIVIAVLLTFLLLLVIGIVITKMRAKPEVGTIFRNPIYGLYYIEDNRIDESVVEIVDRNNMYHADNNEATIEDANPQYAGTSRATNEDANPEYATDSAEVMVVDDQGYARVRGN